MTATKDALFPTLARYNQWANRRLYGACNELTETAFASPRPAFFGSILATLNHVLVGDRVWLARIEGSGHDITALDQILYGTRSALTAAREAEDRRIIAIADALTPARIAETLDYTNFAGEASETPLGLILTHLFNHQTHHRGQVHGLLSATDVAPPSLDLIFYLRETGPGGRPGNAD
ncbi:MAG: DinB family protein [Alphaproteobacteria bacterium]